MLNEYTITSYEITPLTLAILPKKDQNGSTYSYVLEESREYVIHHTPFKVIDEACKFFGSSLRGRMDGTKDVSNITYKPPVAIDPALGMYFFPTASPMNKNCSWIAHSHIESFKPVEYDQTEITFKNGKKIILDVSYGSMMNQVQRTAQFRFALDNRLKLIKTTVLLNEKLK